jgi:hypothetical protein
MSSKEDKELKLLLEKIKKERALEQQQELLAFEKERAKYAKEFEEPKQKKKIVLKKVIKEEEEQFKPVKVSETLKEKLKKHREAKEAEKIIRQNVDIPDIEIQELPKEKKIKQKLISKISKRTPKEANIREHLNTMSLTKLKNIARKSNLHTRIKLSSPKSILVESIAQLYEHENGKFKSKPFELKL